MLPWGSLCKESVVGSVIALFYLAGLLALSDVLQKLVSHSSSISLVCPGSLEEFYCVAAYTYTVHRMLDTRWCKHALLVGGACLCRMVAGVLLSTIPTTCGNSHVYAVRVGICAGYYAENDAIPMMGPQQVEKPSTLKHPK